MHSNLEYRSTTNPTTKGPIMKTLLQLAASSGFAFAFIELAARAGGVA